MVTNALVFALDADGIDLIDIHFENFLDSLLDFDRVGIGSYFKGLLLVSES